MDKTAVWILGILFIALNAAIGFGIMLELDDIQTTIRFTDVACPDEGSLR